MIKRLVIALALVAVTCFAGAIVAKSRAAGPYPAPVEAMRMQGVQIVGAFDAPGGMTGYAGIVDQRSVAIYVTADNKHAIVGYMIDGTGAFVDQATVHDMTAGPMSEQIWRQLEDSTWVAEGSGDAARVVYVFSDPNCPYCHLFWKRAQPWLDAGKIELRHILVGVIAQDSSHKAAAILAANDPEQAFVRNQKRSADGGITPMKDIPAAILNKIMNNQRLMSRLGVRGTPGIFYRDADGAVQQWRGVPSEQEMAAVFGSVKD